MTPTDAASLALAMLLAAFLPGPSRAQAAPEPESCEEIEAFHRLDVRVGRWEVRADGRKVGDDRIEKIVGGCALVEHWRSVAGGEGKSLVYHLPATGAWKQVWVAPRAARPGGVKEKTLLPGYAGPGVRFQGRIAGPGGGSYLDRTTLIPLDDGRVRQVIETSSDGGDSWRVGFDAVYLRIEERSGRADPSTRRAGPSLAPSPTAWQLPRGTRPHPPTRYSILIGSG